MCDGTPNNSSGESSSKAVIELEARLKALTDNLPGGMVYQVATDRRGQDRRFLYLSQSREIPSGLRAAAILEDPLLPYRMLLPEDQQRLVDAEKQAIDLLQSLDIQVRFRREDGEIRWWHLRSTPRPQTDGSLIWDGMQIDVTEQKRAEEALREMNAHLEERVAERTASLEQAHEHLRQSQKMEAIGALTGGVAHDFNNLLSPILGALDLLERKQLGGVREQQLVRGALECAERARLLVQRLLAFARRQPLQPVPLDVGQLVLGMSDLISSTVGPRIITEYKVENDLPPATVDANQLEMALLNLCVNATDAMPEGGRLSLSVDRREVTCARADLRNDSYVCIAVNDTGAGMSEKVLRRAVEPFFSTKKVGKGTGLGLSMVHGLASQLGGGLDIESAPGQGTTVFVFLPVLHKSGPSS